MLARRGMRWMAAAAAVGGVLLAVPGVAAASPRAHVQIYYHSPVLVRPGERVSIPVDVVCATPTGKACRVRAGVRVRAGGASFLAAARGGRAAFDVTAQVARALAAGRSGAGPAAPIAFRVRALRPDGRVVQLPGPSTGPLHLYVAPDMPVVEVATPAAEPARPGVTVLDLPWGSGPSRAGLAVGSESATLGPPSFDVDADGGIYLLDSLQGRVAVFDGGRLVREMPVEVSARADLALGSDGTVHVLSADGDDSLVVRHLDAAGAPGDTSSLGAGILSEIRAAGDLAFVHLLPLDAWVPAATGQGGDVLPGVPDGAGGSVVRAVAGRSVRLARVAGDEVRDAVEVRFDADLGEIALAAPSGTDGYWLVVRVMQPSRASLYEAVRVADGQVVERFTAVDREFALTNPVSKFRIGGDGRLYQLQTLPGGVRIVGYGR